MVVYYEWELLNQDHQSCEMLEYFSQRANSYFEIRFRDYTILRIAIPLRPL